MKEFLASNDVARPTLVVDATLPLTGPAAVESENTPEPVPSVS